MATSLKRVQRLAAVWFVAAGVVLVALAFVGTPAGSATPGIKAAGPPAGSPLIAQVQLRGGLFRPRLKLRTGRVAGSKLPRPRFSGSDKVGPPKQVCGIRGRPPCRIPPKVGDSAPPRPPGCKGLRCPPGRPPNIVTPDPVPPGKGQFSSGFLQSLPRIAEGPGNPNDLGVFFRKQVLVLLDQGQPIGSEDALAQQYRLRRISGQALTLIAARTQLYAILDDRPVATVVSALSGDPRVRLAQENFSYRRQGEADAGQAIAGPQYALVKMSIGPAHALALGRGVRVAVIDSKIDAEHPDLAGVVVSSFDATGRTTQVNDGHGTAVAGIISSRGALKGVAPQAEIMAVRAFAALNSQQPIASSTFILLRAIEWAVTNGARVLNMSFVGPKDGAVQAIIEAAQKRNAIVVAAAGNGGSQAPPAYPAAYPGVIAVTAIDALDRRYDHANRGSYISVSAPGVEVLATADGGRYAFLSGTSFAAAHVSGIVALLLERDASLHPQSVLTALSGSAVDLGPAGHDEDFGFGRADALATLRAISGAK